MANSIFPRICRLVVVSSILILFPLSVVSAQDSYDGENICIIPYGSDGLPVTFTGYADQSFDYDLEVSPVIASMKFLLLFAGPPPPDIQAAMDELDLGLVEFFELQFQLVVDQFSDEVEAYCQEKSSKQTNLYQGVGENAWTFITTEVVCDMAPGFDLVDEVNDVSVVGQKMICANFYSDPCICETEITTKHILWSSYGLTAPADGSPGLEGDTVGKATPTSGIGCLKTEDDCSENETLDPLSCQCVATCECTEGEIKIFECPTKPTTAGGNLLTGKGRSVAKTNKKTSQCDGCTYPDPCISG